MEIKFKAWDEKRKEMLSRDQFRFKYNYDGGISLHRKINGVEVPIKNGKKNLRQFTGFIDKNGNEIYAGDFIKYKEPYRTTQTHTGDNIPNGSYTEPMEPGIKIHEGIVVFKDGCFMIEDDEYCPEPYPLGLSFIFWDLKSIEDAISWSKPGAFIFDDPEEGDLQYLIHEVAKVKDSDELIKFLSGFEIVGNIYENSDKNDD